MGGVGRRRILLSDDDLEDGRESVSFEKGAEMSDRGER